MNKTFLFESIAVMEEQDALFKKSFAAFQKDCSEVDAFLTVGKEEAPKPTPSTSTVKIVHRAAPSDSLSSLMNIMQSKTSLADQTLEQKNDSLLLHTSLLAAGSVWSSDNKEKAPLVREVSNFSVQPKSRETAINTITLQGTMLPISGDRKRFIALNLRQGSWNGRSNDEVMMHINIRVDERRMNDETKYTYRYKNSYKYAQKWVDLTTRTFNPSDWPFHDNRPFWLRIVFHISGIFVYLNGKCFSFMIYPTHIDPTALDMVTVEASTLGESSEKATWSISRLYKGFSLLEGNYDKVRLSTINSYGNILLNVPIRDAVYVTGLAPLDPEILKLQLRDAFREWRVRDVMIPEGKAGVAFVYFDSSTDVSGVMSKRENIAIQGSKVVVNYAIEKKPASSINPSNY